MHKEDKDTVGEGFEEEEHRDNEYKGHRADGHVVDVEFFVGEGREGENIVEKSEKKLSFN